MSSLKHAIVLGMMGLLLSASTSHAGGAKKTTTVKVVNQTSYTVLVTTNPTSAAIQKALADSSLSEFTAAGGKAINTGSSATFSVSAGTVAIAADAVGGTSSSPTLLGYITESISVTAGSTVTVYIVPSTASTGIAFSTKSST